MPVPSFVISIEDIGPYGTRVVHLGEADEAERDARLEAVRSFLEADLASGDWVPRIEMVDRAHAAGVPEKTVDETLKVLIREGLIEREDRRLVSGRGGKSACYRLKTTPSLGPAPETEKEA